MAGLLDLQTLQVYLKRKIKTRLHSPLLWQGVLQSAVKSPIGCRKLFSCSIESVMWQREKVQKTCQCSKFFPLRSWVRTLALTAIIIYSSLPFNIFNQVCGSLVSGSVNKDSLCPE